MLTFLRILCLFLQSRILLGWVRFKVNYAIRRSVNLGNIRHQDDIVEMFNCAKQALHWKENNDKGKTPVIFDIIENKWILKNVLD